MADYRVCRDGSALETEERKGNYTEFSASMAGGLLRHQSMTSSYKLSVELLVSLCIGTTNLPSSSRPILILKKRYRRSPAPAPAHARRIWRIIIGSSQFGISQSSPKENVFRLYSSVFAKPPTAHNCTARRPQFGEIIVVRFIRVQRGTYIRAPWSFV